MLYVFSCNVMSVDHMHVWCLWRPEEGIRCPGIVVRDGYEPSYVSMEANPAPLQKQHVISNAKLSF